MISGIRERDLWWFRELYSVLAAFADEPSNTISRIGGGRISIPEDQANHLGHFRKCILDSYPTAAELEVMKVVTEIDAILERYSSGGKSYDEWFWSNKGFLRHPDWEKIRELSREHLVR